MFNPFDPAFHEDLDFGQNEWGIEQKTGKRENEKTGQTQDPSVIRLSTMGDAMNNSGV